MNNEKPSTNLLEDSGKLPEDRMICIGARDIAAARHDRALEEREELVRLRDLALEAWSEAQDARFERERLLRQLREANEKLVMAVVEAQQLADEANAVGGRRSQRGALPVADLHIFGARLAGDLGGPLRGRSETWRRFTGVDVGPGEAGWLEAVHPDDRERVRQAWTEAVATATPYTCQHRNP
jgi:hypothetical protein